MTPAQSHTGVTIRIGGKDRAWKLSWPALRAAKKQHNITVNMQKARRLEDGGDLVDMIEFMSDLMFVGFLDEDRELDPAQVEEWIDTDREFDGWATVGILTKGLAALFDRDGDAEDEADPLGEATSIASVGNGELVHRPFPRPVTETDDSTRL